MAGVRTPQDGTTVFAPQVTLVGAATEPLASIAVDGRPAILDADGVHWFMTVNTPAEGANILRIDTEDMAGNTNQENLTINTILQGPTVDITDPANLMVTAGDTIAFDAAITGGLAPYTAFEWDLGDGSPMETTQQVTHTYADAGFYAVTLVVTDSASRKGQATVVLQVEPVVIPLVPTLDFTPKPPQAGDTVTFNASGSSGTILRYLWDWDGNGGFEELSTIPILKHTFPASGGHQVVLQVEDEHGQVATTSIWVAVSEGGQIATLSLSTQTLAFHARPGTTGMLARTVTLSNTGPAGSVAVVQVDAGGLPGYIVPQTGTGAITLFSGQSQTLVVEMDPSDPTIPRNQAVLPAESVGNITVTADGAQGSPATVDVQVALEPYGARGGRCGALPVLPTSGGPPADPGFVWLIAIAALLRWLVGRRRSAAT